MLELTSVTLGQWKLWDGPQYHGFCLGVCVSVALVMCVSVYYYFVKVADRCTCTTRLDGKTVIITGANTGIGKETAVDLAHRGARVILACRSESRGIQAEREIREQTGNSHVHFMRLDLASQESVKEFAQEFCNREDRLDILINNAGVINDGSAQTAEGYELSFGVNHLGHFLLTNLLLAKLQSSSPSRVINVSSDAYQLGRLGFQDGAGLLCGKEGRVKLYARSKLANLLFTHELAKTMEGTDVAIFALHPGSINTDIKRNWAWWLRTLSPLISFLFLKTTTEGAQTTIHCAVAEDLQKHSGKYFKGCRVQKVAPMARDDKLSRKLWRVSLQMTGLTNT
ncbi:retinol dehydrogenase 12-like [Patiria miniata]|uniref:Ketoreductase domain-containing protein n=1 Tax=Patiria miniata TaxID=46514 RepID=A0A914ADZ9_PATMI|nr:retinol dehydrogenase 12-like [Patiria miniata]